MSSPSPNHQCGGETNCGNDFYGNCPSPSPLRGAAMDPITNCRVIMEISDPESYPKGGEMTVFSCLTCASIRNNNRPVSVCECCAGSCHEGHALVEVASRPGHSCKCAGIYDCQHFDAVCEARSAAKGNSSPPPAPSTDCISGSGAVKCAPLVPVKEFSHNFVSRWCLCRGGTTAGEPTVKCVSCLEPHHSSCMGQVYITQLLRTQPALRVTAAKQANVLLGARIPMLGGGICAQAHMFPCGDLGEEEVDAVVAESEAASVVGLDGAPPSRKRTPPSGPRGVMAAVLATEKALAAEAARAFETEGALMVCPECVAKAPGITSGMAAGHHMPCALPLPSMFSPQSSLWRPIPKAPLLSEFVETMKATSSVAAPPSVIGMAVGAHISGTFSNGVTLNNAAVRPRLRRNGEVVKNTVLESVKTAVVASFAVGAAKLEAPITTGKKKGRKSRKSTAPSSRRTRRPIWRLHEALFDHWRMWGVASDKRVLPVETRVRYETSPPIVSGADDGFKVTLASVSPAPPVLYFPFSSASTDAQDFTSLGGASYNEACGCPKCVDERSALKPWAQSIFKVGSGERNIHMSSSVGSPPPVSVTSSFVGEFLGHTSPLKQPQLQYQPPQDNYSTTVNLTGIPSTWMEVVEAGMDRAMMDLGSTQISVKLSAAPTLPNYQVGSRSSSNSNPLNSMASNGWFRGGEGLPSSWGTQQQQREERRGFTVAPSSNEQQPPPQAPPASYRSQAPIPPRAPVPYSRQAQAPVSQAVVRFQPQLREQRALLSKRKGGIVDDILPSPRAPATPLHSLYTEVSTERPPYATVFGGKCDIGGTRGLNLDDDLELIAAVEAAMGDEMVLPPSDGFSFLDDADGTVPFLEDFASSSSSLSSGSAFDDCMFGLFYDAPISPL